MIIFGGLEQQLLSTSNVISIQFHLSRHVIDDIPVIGIPVMFGHLYQFLNVFFNVVLATRFVNPYRIQTCVNRHDWIDGMSNRFFIVVLREIKFASHLIHLSGEVFPSSPFLVSSSVVERITQMNSRAIPGHLFVKIKRLDLLQIILQTTRERRICL